MQSRPQHLLTIVCSLTLAAMFPACVPHGGLGDDDLGSVAQPSSGGELCAFVIGSFGGQSFTTPVIPVFVPDSDAEIDPAHIHVDETHQSILGYSVTIPGVDLKTDEQRPYVPGVDQTIPSFVATLPQLDVLAGTCLAAIVSTPAIPIHIPASVLETPGAFIDVPRIGLNLLGNPATMPGRLIELDHLTIVLPGADFVVPGQELDTPQKTLVVEIDGTQEATHIMDHPL